MRPDRLRSAALLLIFGVLLTAGVAAGVSRALGEAALEEPAPEWFGSRAETRARLSASDSGSYSFVVLGDIQQGLNAVRHSLEFASEVPDLRFVVACGDLVNNRSEPHYRLLYSVVSQADPGVPVLTVPGNHDNAELYRAQLGPSPWSARVGPDLLIGVDNGRRVPDRAELDALTSILREDGVRHRFVFLHRPFMKGDRPRPGFGPLFETLERGGADVIFAGHTHRYERDERNGVLHISNGMGGDISHDMDGTAVVTVVSVTGEKIQDRAVSLGKHSEFGSHIEDTLVAHLYAPLRGSWIWVAGIALLLALSLVFGFFALGRRAFLPTVALFAPAVASPPAGPLLVGGYAALGVAALLTLRRGRQVRAGFGLALVAVLVLARSPWLAAASAVPIGLVFLGSPGLLRRPMRPVVATLSIMATILLVAVWTGDTLLLPAASAAAVLPVLRR